MIYTNLIDLPSSVREFVHVTVDGDYVVFINKNLSQEAQTEAFHHAMEHIQNDDFASDQSADMAERRILCG